MSLRLAYADPPYPGMAGLYPENTEVDHVELIAKLCEYDGWALSTDERSLHYVLGLCPPHVRILAWCRTNAPPLQPNPFASWEPVILRPARTRPVNVRSYIETAAPIGFLQQDGLTGQKTEWFCEWVIRCLGASPEDSLDDLFPGTGVMGMTWRRWQMQPSLQSLARGGTRRAHARLVRKTTDPLPGFSAPVPPGKIRKEKGR